MAKAFPDDLKYTQEHEWARISGKRAVIGITSYAVESLGDLTMVDLPKEGETFKREQSMATVESVKAVSDIFAPLSGKVVKVNDPLSDAPETLNDDCYDEGWMIKIEISDDAQIGQLLKHADYLAFLESQAE